MHVHTTPSKWHAWPPIKRKAEFIFVLYKKDINKTTNMRRLTSFMHISLDGFTTDAEGSMRWVKVDEELFDYAGFATDASDLAIYGRVTYQMMDAYWPTAGDEPGASKHDKEHSAWYNTVQKVIVSKTMNDADKANTTFVSDDVHGQINALKQQEGRNMVMFGSPGLVHTMMHYNLIDDYWLFINPVLLGAGKRYFDDINQRIDLKLVENKTFSNGVIGLHYEKA